MADEEKDNEQLMAELAEKDSQLADKDSALADLRQQRAVEQAAERIREEVLAMRTRSINDLHIATE